MIVRVFGSERLLLLLRLLFVNIIYHSYSYYYYDSYYIHHTYICIYTYIHLERDMFSSSYYVGSDASQRLEPFFEFMGLGL